MVSVKECETAGEPTLTVPKLKEVGVSAPVAPSVKLQTCKVTGALAGSRFQNPKLVEVARKFKLVPRVEVTPFCVTCRLAVCATILTLHVIVAGVPGIHETAVA